MRQEMVVERKVSKKTGNEYNIFKVKFYDGGALLYSFETFVTEEQAFILNQMLDRG